MSAGPWEGQPTWDQGYRDGLADRVPDESLISDARRWQEYALGYTWGQRDRTRVAS